MRPGFVCVAGLDDSTSRHIRPVVAGQLPRRLAATEGGPFGIGEVIDLGEVSPRPHAPEVEDYLFEPGGMRPLATLSERELWEAVSRVAVQDPRGVIGADLVLRDQSLVVEPGKGSGSLVSWRPEGVTKIWIRQGSARFGVFVDGIFCDFALNDLGLYEADQQTARTDGVARLAKGIAERPFVASAGLTREFNGVHWLQVNNVHLAPR